MNRFETLIEKCNADIRDGNPHLVLMRLSRYQTARIPRPWKLPIARICRRAGLYGMGLKMLSRLIHRTSAGGPSASAAEVTEYAALLLRSGAVDEALQKLMTVDANEVPEKSLIQAFAHFARWEYDLAIIDLETFLQAPIPPDTALMGSSNLAFALVECRRHEQAHRLIRENLRTARERGHYHLENYNHALLGQVYLQEGRLREARGAIELALRQTASAHQFFAMKLKLILDGLETKDLRPLEELRSLAVSKRDWYALRDAELFSLQVEFNQNRFLHLYFGSPLERFRELIRNEIGRAPLQQTFVLGDDSAPRFDLIRGEIEGRRVDGAGMLAHQLTEVLLRDFYEPLRIAGLHAALFPGEHFNIHSSPNRVYQVIRRSRIWLKANSVPVSIDERNGFYSLKISGPISFLIPLERKPVDLVDLQLARLLKLFVGNRLSSAKEIQVKLDMSIASVHRLLNRAIEQGMIERVGPTKRTLGYRIKQKQGTTARAA